MRGVGYVTLLKTNRADIEPIPVFSPGRYKTTDEKQLASFSMHSHPLLGGADEEEVGCITKPKTLSEPKCRTFAGEEQKQMRRKNLMGFI